MWVTNSSKNGGFANRVIEIPGFMTEDEIRKQEEIVEDSFNAVGVTAVITNFIVID